jgi:hypothetical protein
MRRKSEWALPEMRLRGENPIHPKNSPGHGTMPIVRTKMAKMGSMKKRYTSNAF